MKQKVQSLTIVIVQKVEAEKFLQRSESQFL